MERSDQEAVQAALAGKREAFDELMRRYAGGMSALAYDRLGTVADAQDAVQETFLTAYRTLRTLKDVNAFGAWVYGILRNVCARKYRDSGIDRRAREVLEKKRAGVQSLTPLDKAVATERAHRVRRAVEGLTPPLREIIVLRYLGGAGRQEAAAMLDISLDAADKRLERALRELRERLKE